LNCPSSAKRVDRHARRILINNDQLSAIADRSSNQEPIRIGIQLVFARLVWPEILKACEASKVPYSEYPAAMVFYKMQRAGLLEGMPDAVDMSAAWQLVAIHDDIKAKVFMERYGMKVPSRFRHVPDSFARLLAKIGYCHMLTILEPTDFRPVCLPYILGEKRNPSYIVGGTFDVAPPDPHNGYVLNTLGFIETGRMMLLAEIRLFSNLHTPIYHVVVGDVRGAGSVEALLKKLGPLRLPAREAHPYQAKRHRSILIGYRAYLRCRFGQNFLKRERPA
jgi:hypothetical protein